MYKCAKSYLKSIEKTEDNFKQFHATSGPQKWKKFWAGDEGGWWGGGRGGGGLGVYKKMLAKLVSWLGRWFDWNRLKCLEILNSVEMIKILNMNRYLFSIFAESVIKIFKHFKSLGIWSLSVGFWRFNVSWFLINVN